MKTMFVKLLCLFIPSKKLRHKLRSKKESEYIYFSLKPYYNNGKNNKIVVIKDGKRKTLSKFQKISRIDIDFGDGDNNLIEIEFPILSNWGKSLILIKSGGNNNKLYIGKNFKGRLLFGAYGSNSVFKCGQNVASSGTVNILLVDNSLYIGDDCMLSTDIIFHGDGHAVFDYKTGEVINKPKNISKIGNRCWLGMHTVFLKGAEVPDDSIVGFGSVVTKKFDTPHVVIAGNPAKVVREGVSWAGLSPIKYEQSMQNKKSL